MTLPGAAHNMEMTSEMPRILATGNCAEEFEGSRHCRVRSLTADGWLLDGITAVNSAAWTWKKPTKL